MVNSPNLSNQLSKVNRQLQTHVNGSKLSDISSTPHLIVQKVVNATITPNSTFPAIAKPTTIAEASIPVNIAIAFTAMGVF